MPDRKTVVAFGDSTTAPREGVATYVELLQREWEQAQLPVHIVNAGVRGDHTERALARFEADVVAHKPDVVIVRFGINDSAIDVWETPPASRPRVPLARFLENIERIVAGVHGAGASALICTPNPLAWSDITLPLYGRPPYDPGDADGFNVTLRDYVAAIRTFAEERKLPLIDLDAAFRQFPSEVRPCWNSLLLDGMHPNNAGHQLAAQLLFPALNALLGLPIETSE